MELKLIWNDKRHEFYGIRRNKQTDKQTDKQIFVYIYNIFVKIIRWNKSWYVYAWSLLAKF